MRYHQLCTHLRSDFAAAAAASLLLLTFTASPARATVALPVEGALTKTFQVPWDRIDAKDLLVLVNSNDPQSVAVADDYMARYSIANGNRLNLSFTKTAIMRDTDFPPVRNAIAAYLQAHAHIQAIVVTWTEPWKVAPPNTSAGMSITSAITFGFAPEYYNTSGGTCAATAVSPLYAQELSHPYRDFGLRPAMMLAGESSANVSSMLSRSTSAKSTFPLPTGYLVRTTDDNRSVRYPEMQTAAAFWNYPFGLRLNYIDNSRGDPSNNSITNRMDVLYYFTGLVQVDHLDTLQFVRGAVADHLTSSGGALTNTSQMSILRWLEAGASGSYGTVAEPCNFVEKFTDVELFLSRYFHGALLIDAYWQAVKEPGEGIFVGDPLTQPYAPRARMNAAGQIELSTTGLADAHVYKVMGLDAGGVSTKLLDGVQVDTPQLRVLSLPAGYATYKLLDTGNLYQDHGAPQLTAASVSRLDLRDGTVRFDVHADDREGDQVLLQFPARRRQALRAVLRPCR